jgi:hypothetical protein
MILIEVESALVAETSSVVREPLARLSQPRRDEIDTALPEKRSREVAS